MTPDRFTYRRRVARAMAAGTRPPMRFHAEGTVKAAPAEVFAWWTDVEEGDAGGVMPPLRRRRIVRRTATEVETEDRWSIFGVPMVTRATLRPLPPDAWEVTSRLRGGVAHDIVRVEAVPGGTRVVMNLDMDLRWPWTWAARLARPLLARLFREDLEAVNRALEASLRAPGSAPPTPPSAGTPSGSSPRP